MLRTSLYLCVCDCCYSVILVCVHTLTFFHDPLSSVQVELLRNISHPHILTMIGACSEHRCIVFEYTQNGSLHDILFPSSPKNHTLPLPWRARIRIVGNVCSALGFLHSSQPRPTAHGRLNSSHVLLDSNLTAKITGLHSCSVASPVSDITALGLLILQLLTGNEEVCMQEVRLATEEDTLAEMLDQNAGDWPLDIAKEFARIGLRCSEEANRDEQGVPMLIGEMMKEVEDLRAKAEGLVVHGGDKPNPLDIPDIFLCPIFQVSYVQDCYLTISCHNICHFACKNLRKICGFRR